MATTTTTGNIIHSAAPAGNDAYTVKVRLADDLRRFGFSGGNFQALTGLVRRLFGIPEQVPIGLKYRDDENDLVTLSSDAELAEARKINPQLLHLVLSVPDAPVFKFAPAPGLAPVLASPVTPGQAPEPMPIPAFVPMPMRGRGWWANRGHRGHPGHHMWHHGGHHAVHGAAAPAPAAAPGAAPAPAPAKPIPEWKQEKLALVGKWKEERCALKDQIRALKADKVTDKKVLKEQIVQLRQQVLATKRELQRMPKDGVMLARFVADVTLPDGTEVAPGASVVKTWRFRNDAQKPWPEGSQMLLVSKKGDKLGAPDAIPVPSVQPTQEVEISVPLKAPAQAGRYTAYFRLSGPAGKKFGQRVWAMINVLEASGSSDDQADVKGEVLVKFAAQLKMLGEMGYTDVKLNVRVLQKTNGILQKAVEMLIKRQQRKGALPAL